MFKSIKSEPVNTSQQTEARKQETEEKERTQPGSLQSSVLGLSQPSTRSSDSTLSASRNQLREWMQQCRQATLNLFTGIDYETFCYQAHPDFSPIGWHLGHIAYTESLWLLEKCAGLPPQSAQHRRLFAADGLPKSERVHLPTLSETQTYLGTVRTQVFDYLEQAPLDQQERLWRWLLQHESQHAETIALVLEIQKSQVAGSRGQGAGEGTAMGRGGDAESAKFKINSELKTQNLTPPPHNSLICIPAGYFECGNEAINALDNERPVHQVYLDTYWIDRYPVTCGQYRVFIESGGYQNSHWWSTTGWEWLQSVQVTQPLYWQDEPEWEHHPVCGVSWYEADAYARFVGKRLPTETEWEKAASWNPLTEKQQLYPWGEAEPAGHCNHHQAIGHTTPVDSYPEGKSAYGCYDLLGNVWEWTDNWFDGYNGFTPYPYRGYSQIYFDQNHRVLRGGSWATFQWGLRCAFRNWYHPHVREMLAGFRCAASIEAGG